MDQLSPPPADGEEVPVSFLGFDIRELNLWICKERVPAERFPPCIQRIMGQQNQGRGKTRASAVFAAFLGQVGWTKEEAQEIWKKVVQERDLAKEIRIFNRWFQEMNCPSCRTIQKESRGYPRLGLAGLGYCQPNEICLKFASPVEYAAGGKDVTLGWLKVIRTAQIVRLYHWPTGREISLEISPEERAELEQMLLNKGDKELVLRSYRDRGRSRLSFILREQGEPRRFVLTERL
jgi:hypothetical protein